MSRAEAIVPVGGAAVRVARWFAPLAILGPWLLLLTSRQVALYPTGGVTGFELLPGPLVVGVIAAAAFVRVLRPTVATHFAFLAIVTRGIALLAAQLGSPLANASDDYCGDFCRTAIMGRFATFFGWPIVTAGLLVVVARSEAGSGGDGAGRARWTRVWAAMTLVLGLVASVAWWRIILPNG